MQKIASVRLLFGVFAFMPSSLLCLSASPSYADVIGVNSASALGANDTISWGQLSAGSNVVYYTGPLGVISTNGNAATVSVGGDNVFYRVDQAPSGIYSGDYAPGTQLISSGHNYEGILIAFAQPVYGGGAQVREGSYGAYTATVIAFSGQHQLGTYSAAGVATDQANNSVKFIGLLSNTPSITSLLFLVDSVNSLDQTTLATISLNANVHPVPLHPSWPLTLIGFAGIGFMAYRRKSNLTVQT
jgi:hypothetical protein